MVREKADRILNDVLDAASLGTVDTGNGKAADDDAPATKTANGTRSRSRAASTSAPAS